MPEPSSPPSPPDASSSGPHAPGPEPYIAGPPSTATASTNGTSTTGARTAMLRKLARHESPEPAGRSVDPLSAAARAGRAEPEQLCELCGESLPERHKHLLELTERDIRCVCQACGVLFDRREAAGGRYRTVPGTRARLSDVRIDDVLWAGLRVPVRLAFFVCHESAEHAGTAAGTPTESFADPPAGIAAGAPAGPAPEESGAGPASRPWVTAHYPSPLGVISAAVDDDAWRRVEEANPVLRELDTEVVALVAHRDADEYWLVGIDDCYRLAARVRDTWSGMTGGDEVWQEIEDFFTGLRAGEKHTSSSANPR